MLTILPGKQSSEVRVEEEETTTESLPTDFQESPLEEVQPPLELPEVFAPTTDLSIIEEEGESIYESGDMVEYPDIEDINEEESGSVEDLDPPPGTDSEATYLAEDEPAQDVDECEPITPAPMKEAVVKSKSYSQSPKKRARRVSFAAVNHDTPAEDPKVEYPALPVTEEPCEVPETSIPSMSSGESNSNESLLSGCGDEQGRILAPGSCQASTTTETNEPMDAPQPSDAANASLREPDTISSDLLDEGACADIALSNDATSEIPMAACTNEPTIAEQATLENGTLDADEALPLEGVNLQNTSTTEMSNFSSEDSEPAIAIPPSPSNTDEANMAAHSSIKSIASELVTCLDASSIAKETELVEGEAPEALPQVISDQEISNTEASEEDDESAADDVTMQEPHGIDEQAQNDNFEEPASEDSDGSFMEDDMTYELTVPIFPDTFSTLDDSTKEESSFVPEDQDVQDEMEETTNIAVNSPTEELTSHLDYDTALLKDFLNRNAASKASKAISAANIARRTSLQNRRDSDAVRHALASALVLEDKDVNSPARAKPPTSSEESAPASRNRFADMDLDKPVTKQKRVAETVAAEPATSSERRRSSRARTSRLPAAAPTSTSSLPVPAKISVRPVNGTDVVELQKDEIAERNAIVRTNTKRNKTGATPAPKRLRKLLLDHNSLISTDEGRSDLQRVLAWERVLEDGQKGVRWKEQLVEYQESSAPETASDADGTAQTVESSEALKSVRRRSVIQSETAQPEQRISPPLETTSTVAAIAEASAPGEVQQTQRSSRVRRARGLGSVNGTPAKGLLASADLPTDLEVKEQKPAPKERKSRLAAPKKVKMPSASSGIPKPKGAAESTAGKIEPQGSIAVASTTVQVSALPAASGIPKKREIPAAAAATEQENRLLSPKNLLSPRKRSRTIAFSASTSNAVSAEAEEKVSTLLLSPKRAMSPRKKGFSASTNSIFGGSVAEEQPKDKEDRRLLSPKRLVSPRKRLFAGGDGLSSSLGPISALNFNGSLSDPKMSGLMSPARRPSSPRKKAAAGTDMRKRARK